MPTARSDRPRKQPRRLMVALCAAGAATLLLPAVGEADPKPTLDQVQAQVDDLNHQAEQAAERFNAATDQLADVRRRLGVAQANVDRQQAKVETLTKDMGGFAAASYRSGGLDPTMQVFLAENPAEFLAQASVVDAYANQQTTQLKTVAVERQRLAEEQAAADEEAKRLAAVEGELKSQKDSVEGTLAKSEKLLKSLKASDRARLVVLQNARTTQQQAAKPKVEAAVAAVAAAPTTGRGAAAVAFAMAQMGEPYRWGATGPGSWDCSGLTLMAWRAAGVSLPRSAAQQIGAGTRISKSQLQPGDLVFFYSPISHVAMYIGNGLIVHAPHPGSRVEVVSVDLMPYSGASRPG